jgi:molybdate/tungstate transport system substrate-binding protein
MVSLHSRLFILSVLILLGLSVSNCSAIPPAGKSTSEPGKTPLVVFAAGSLIIPFGDIETAFESHYPNIDVQAEYHGSIQVIRHVTELHKAIDVVASADASLIPMLMYAQNNPDTNRPYADWYIRFASNRLAIAYTPVSKYSGGINVNNWYSILTRSDVKVGIADPRFDATGYRALMVYALAQNYYGKSTIFKNMFSDNFSFPLSLFTDNDLLTITVPEIVETRPNSHIVIRGASVQLIALLESGDLDYAFEYESVIQQHKLDLLHLPDAINLGSGSFSQAYGTVQVDLDFQRFASVKPQFRGEQIGYGITVPSNALHPELAAQFIAFLLGPEGRAIMKKNYHPLFAPAIGDRYNNIPAALQELCESAPIP